MFANSPRRLLCAASVSTSGAALAFPLVIVCGAIRKCLKLAGGKQLPKNGSPLREGYANSVLKDAYPKLSNIKMFKD